MKCSNQVPTIVSLNNGKVQHLHLHNLQLNNESHSSNNSNQIKSNLSSNKMNILDYYPELNNDGIFLNWDHAVNSKSLLDQALNSSSHIIEADVSLQDNKFNIPIMAHPPNLTSDLTLEEFLQKILNSKIKKGIKLDFKSTRVVEPAFRIISKYYQNLQDRPLLLNADILNGDYSLPNIPVDPWTFLMLSSTRFPRAILSIGWCVQTNEQYLKTGYSRKMIDDMLSVIKQYNINQNYTFAVNGALMKNSLNNLEYLLSQSNRNHSSLTIWSHQTDPLTLDDLLKIRQNFTPNRLFYDIPKDLLAQFRSVI